MTTETTTATTKSPILDDLEAGRVRAAWPDPQAPDGWRVDDQVKAAILDAFRDRTTRDWQAGPLTFRDRAALAPRADLAGGPWRIVPGGTAVRRGAHPFNHIRLAKIDRRVRPQRPSCRQPLGTGAD